MGSCALLPLGMKKRRTSGERSFITEKTVKSILGIDGTAVGPNGHFRLRRECAVQAFSPQVKTLAEGRLCRPRAFKYRRVEPPFGRRNPKQKDILSDVLCFGKALQSRYFKFSIRHLEILPNGPSEPRRFCGVRAFCRRQNLGGGMALPSRAFESPKGGAGPRPAKPKKKDTL